ncbi:pentatricopeptide repeat-containing protein At4g16390, chloroplastic-like [Coffea arabica]|uniref:Pentatricopeptide repeat-containing protein At4g16390, chloroplastic-like n=1 Tax=Coffea arabica TaxID=13443 RepID=A0A6P6UEK8_COFAR
MVAASYSPSHVSRDPHLFCNSLYPTHLHQLRIIAHNALAFHPLKPHPKPSLSIPASQQQSPSISQIPHRPDAKTISSSSKSYIWVNPNSSRASKLRRNSYDFRYASLVQASQQLDSCDSVEADVICILANLGGKVLEQDAAVVLNNMSNSETAPLVLRYFLERLKLKKEVILYNVTFKVFRKCRDLDRAEKLFTDMIERGVKPDNVTFSTIISCARLSSLPEKAVQWFEKMPSFGCEPDVVTYSVMIDAYGKAGNVNLALTLYDRARTEKWRIDAATFSTLIRIYGTAGNFDGCLNVYEEMKALGVRPNLVVYNSLLDLSVVLYNTLLSISADVGFIDEAVEIFEAMKGSESCKPDSWTYSSMITIYSCSGKVFEAESTLNEMLEAGFEPNIYVLTSLIQCYGKANRIDDVVRTFDRLLGLGITPDERFCGCLLNVMTQAPTQELDKLTRCIQKADAKLGHVVKLLVGEENIEGDILRKEAGELFHEVGSDVRKAYCNCLIDLCIKIDLLEKACELLDLGLKLEIYTDIQSRTPTQWSLHLKSLSLGAALTALHIWINDLSKALESGEELPSLLGINTGHGKHKYSEKGLAGVFDLHLKELNAPFHEAPDKAGWFLTTKVAATSWLESRSTPEVVAA